MKTKPYFAMLVTLLIVIMSVGGLTAAMGDNDIYPKIKSAIAIYNYDSLKSIQEALIIKNEKDKSLSNVLYYLAYSEYKLLEMCQRGKNTSNFDEIKQSAETHTGILIEEKGFESEGKVILAGIYMMRIAHNWSEAIALSPLLYSTLAEAEKLNKNNPRVFLLRGMMKFNTPEMFGGSKEEALTNFLKASSLFENAEEGKEFNPEWGYLETLAWTGQVYAKLGNVDTARFYYTKVLTIEPEYGWVKYVLLPTLDKQ